VFVNDSINPEIYFWPNVGDVHVFNNLIYVGNNGDILPTFIQNSSNTLDISHNLFFDSSRIDLDNDLLNNALFSNPQLINPSPDGVDNPSVYKILNTSIAVGTGKLIYGSSDTTDYLNNNGGKDYFGNPVSAFEPPNIGAYNGNVLNIVTSKKDNIVTAYPTATVDNVTIFIEDFNGLMETYVYDLKGEFLGSQKGENISLSKFKKGVYVLKVNFEKKTNLLKVIKL
jgi:hypothetical protein